MIPAFNEWRAAEDCRSSPSVIETRPTCARSLAISFENHSRHLHCLTARRARVGTAVFTNVPTVWHERPIFAGESGLLGLGVLSKCRRVTLDGKANRLTLE